VAPDFEVALLSSIHRMNCEIMLVTFLAVLGHLLLFPLAFLASSERYSTFSLFLLMSNVKRGILLGPLLFFPQCIYAG